MKRTLCVSAAWTLAAAGLLAQDAMRFADVAAENLFNRSRSAVVLSGSVRDLRALILRGRLRSTADDGSPLEGKVEIKILLPDCFLETETFGPYERLTGYAGKSLLTATRDHGAVEVPPSKLTTPLLTLAHADFTRLMLGAATYIPTDQEPTFRTSSATVQLVDPRQQARASATITPNASDPFSLDVASDSFSVRFVVDTTTRVPAQLVYQGSKRAETTMTFADRRAVGGLLMPYRITRTSAGRLVDTFAFDEILVNPELARNEFRRESK
jgi:hypothetical protein